MTKWLNEVKDGSRACMRILPVHACVHACITCTYMQCMSTVHAYVCALQACLQCSTCVGAVHECTAGMRAVHAYSAVHTYMQSVRCMRAVHVCVRCVANLAHLFLEFLPSLIF